MEAASDLDDGSWKDKLASCSWNKREEGYYEVEFVESGKEDDLYKKRDSCNKPDHLRLIPLKEFSEKNLSEKHRTPRTMDFIKQVCDRTVRIRVKYISMERSLTGPSAHSRGCHVLLTGTGYITQVKRHYPGDGCACPCVVCARLPENQLSWARVTISTAAHLISTKDELVHAEIDLFYDSDDDKVGGESSKMTTLRGWWVRNLDNILLADTITDTCEFSVITHDVDFFGITTDMVSLYQRQTTLIEESQLVVIVSHPHGCSKCISVGVLQGKRNQRRHGLFKLLSKDIRYEYTAPTCPGSSGAAIHVLDDSKDVLVDNMSVHSGGLWDGRNVSADKRSASRFGKIVMKIVHSVWVWFISGVVRRYHDRFGP